MARKKYYADDTKVSSSENSTNKTKVALYIRLSREDGDKIESDSVNNQRNLLTNYINDKTDFNIIDTYIDDGYTGTNFDRPAFNHMLSE